MPRPINPRTSPSPKGRFRLEWSRRSFNYTWGNMRTIGYRSGSGTASKTAAIKLNELALILESAVSLAHVERSTQKHIIEGAAIKLKTPKLPTTVPAGKTTPYEVTVVDAFMRIGALSFASHGSTPRWERTLTVGTSKVGRPISIDLCLFNPRTQEEARIEFGSYTRDKLESEAAKLTGLSLTSVLSGWTISNYVMLWRLTDSRVLKSSTVWPKECIADAAAASTAAFTVQLKVASEQDLFTTKRGEERKVQVGLFAVS